MTRQPGAGARACLALLGLVCGCAPRSPGEIVARQQEATKSLVETAMLVDRDWRAGALPRHFATEALASVETSLAEQGKAVTTNSALPTTTRHALAASAAGAAARVHRLRDLIEGSAPRPRRPQ